MSSAAPTRPALRRPAVIQPALWAVMVPWPRLWQAAGIDPAAVAGHSQGEIAAACVAGVLTLDDAAAVIARRARALAALPPAAACWPPRPPPGQAAALAAPRARGRHRGGQRPRRDRAVRAPPDLAGRWPLPAPGPGSGPGCCRSATPPTPPRSSRWPPRSPRSWTASRPGPARIPMISAMTGQPLSGPGRPPVLVRQPARPGQLHRGHHHPGRHGPGSSSKSPPTAR